MSDLPLKVIDGLSQPRRGPAAIQLAPGVYGHALDCVHCGLCLPACPTYLTNGLESDSPRGRIMLIKGLADGTVEPTDAVIRHLDLCLDCRACETACPSGVVYHELIEAARPQLASRRRASWRRRLMLALARHLFAYPARMRAALVPARLMRRLGLWSLVERLPVAELLPSHLPDGVPSPGLYRARGPRRAVVGLFTGCVGGVLFAEVQRQAIALLQWAGCDVLVPRGQVCCGAIHHHSGDAPAALALARRNLDAFLGQVDMVVSAVAGCGAMLGEYAHLLGEEATRGWRVRDISVALEELGLPAPERPLRLTAVYHDACHLAHAQGVTDPPRRLLGRIDGLTLMPLPESDLCCGAAGTYNLLEPDMARALGERKLRRIQAAGAEVCVTGNAGCALHLEATARRLGVSLRIVHPVSLLHEACLGRDGAAAVPDREA